jgi:hypothetical protein
MAYKLQTQKILPGGLNLLAPGDQVTEGDCLDLTGWWAGAAGRLEQAPRSIVWNANPSWVIPADSLCQVDGRIYWSDYNGTRSLRQVGRTVGGTLEAAIDTGFDSAPLGMISYQGFAWIMNRATGKQRKDDGTTVTDWSPPPPGVPTLTDGGLHGTALTPAVGNPPENGGLLAQEYSYFITWQLGTLGETNPSTVGGVITPATITPALDGSIVRVTLPTPPANATGWNIYRKGPALLTPYRLNEGTIDITRTYVDDYGDALHTHSDDNLLSLGIVMEANHDPAPACKVIATQLYNGRIVVANSAANPNRIWYTPALQPGFFRGSGNPNEGDWVDCGTDKGDEILAMTVRPGIVVIYRSRTIWRHVGDFGDVNARLECVVPDLGIVGVRAVAQTSLGDYFVSNDGVYKFNNDWAQKLSAKVEPVFRGQVTEDLTQLATAYRSRCAIGYRNGRLWISYPSGGGTNLDSLIYHVDSQRWFADGAGSQGYGAFLDVGTEFLGAGNGLFALEHSYGASGLGFHSEYQDGGLPDHEKTWADLVLNHNTHGQTLTIVIRTNKYAGSNDSFTLTTIVSSALTKQVIALLYPSDYAVTALRGQPIRAYNLSVRITGTGAASAPPVIIDTPMLLHCYLEARRAKSFDSDETDHGAQGVKTVDQMEFDIDATAGNALLLVYSDVPGGAMVDRTSGGVLIPQTAGRQLRRLVLAAPADGNLLRYRAGATTEFQIYGMRARLLRIGVYLDGTVGDFWQPQPISIGV